MSDETGYGTHRDVTRWLPLACFLALAACGDRGPNAAYYYPVDELLDGLVYAYEPAAGTDAEVFPGYYWYYRAVETPDSTVLAATYYDADGEPRQYVGERIVGEGALLRDLRLYRPTDSASVVTEADVLAPAVFSFREPDPARVLVAAVGFRQNDSSATYTVTRNRRYARDTTLAVGGDDYAAQVWTVRELIEQDSAGTMALESRGVEVYAEGLGLVYRERVHGDGTVEAHRLARRFPMSELERRFGGDADANR